MLADCVLIIAWAHGVPDQVTVYIVDIDFFNFLIGNYIRLFVLEAKDDLLKTKPCMTHDVIWVCPPEWLAVAIRKPDGVNPV